jgi:hypothetical protein
MRDRQLNYTVRVSVSTFGAQGNGGSSYPFISNNGWFVTFHSDASNLVSDDTNGMRDVFIHELEGNTPTPSITPSPVITNTPTASQTPTPSITPSITPTSTNTPTYTPTRTSTITFTPTNTATPSITPTQRIHIHLQLPQPRQLLLQLRQHLYFHTRPHQPVRILQPQH